MEHAVQAIAHLVALADEALPMADQSPVLAHVRARRDPHGGDEPSRQQLGQVEGIPPIGLDARGGDQLDQQRVADGDRAHQRAELIVQVPGIGGRLEYDRIRPG